MPCGDHTLSICKMNAIYQTLFMCCVGYKVRSNTDLTHEAASVQKSITSLQSIFLKMEKKTKLCLYIIVCKSSQNNENRRKLSGCHVARNETEGWRMEEGDSFCFASDSLFLQSQYSAPCFTPDHHQLRGKGAISTSRGQDAHISTGLSTTASFKFSYFFQSSQQSSPCSKSQLFCSRLSPSVPQPNYSDNLLNIIFIFY